MPILQQASIEDRKRLLELFPVANLRQIFQAKGTKEEICYAGAASAEAVSVQKVAEFVNEHLGCCKQHVYVFAHDGTAAVPVDVVDGEKILDGGGIALYLSRAKYTVVMRDPLEESTLEFLWPIRVDRTANHLIVRFVVLEKNPSSYFDRSGYVAGKSLTEKTVLAGIAGALHARRP